MPWKSTGARKRTEENPQIADLWAVLRQMQNALGGLVAEVATINLAVTRLDARHEHTAGVMRDAIDTLKAGADT